MKKEKTEKEEEEEKKGVIRVITVIMVNYYQSAFCNLQKCLKSTKVAVSVMISNSTLYL